MEHGTIYSRTKTTSPKKSKLKRLKRAAGDELPSLQLTERDYAILQAVYDYRALATPQIDALFFSQSRAPLSGARPNSRCLHRLKLLYHHGFLCRTEQPQTLAEGRKPLVYSLDVRGARLVAQQQGVDFEQLKWSRSDRTIKQLFLDHLLASNQVRVGFVLSALAKGAMLDTWLDERGIRLAHADEMVDIHDPQNPREVLPVKLFPDGYFSLTLGENRYRVFLEIDRGTETVSTTDWKRPSWTRKILAYLQYYRSGLYQARYHTRSLRILTVTTSEKRLASLKEATEKADGQRRFWFTTFEQVATEDVLTAPIWQIATKEGLHAMNEL